MNLKGGSTTNVAGADIAVQAITAETVSGQAAAVTLPAELTAYKPVAYEVSPATRSSSPCGITRN
jgi:hypothetical protein